MFRVSDTLPYSHRVLTNDAAAPRWTPSGWQGRAGIGRTEITPPIGIRMRNWGYGDQDVSTAVHSTHTATALALSDYDDASSPRVIITLDLGWWRTLPDFEQVRSAVLGATGIGHDDLLLHLTHTHAGPSICREDEDLPGGELVPAHLDFIAAQTAAAASAAIADLGPAVLDAQTGHHPLAAVRDIIHEGQPLLGFDPSQHPDDTLLVVRASRLDGTALATIVNYACHPTTLGHDNSHVSPDYVGPMRAVVEAATDAPCLFLQGASGELAPREQYSDSIDLVDRHGRSLGYAVLALLETLPGPGNSLELTDVIQSGAPLAIWEQRSTRSPEPIEAVASSVTVPVKELPSLAELKRSWEGIDPRSRTERLRRAERLRETYDGGATAEHPFWVWRLGSLVVVAQPGEAYSLLQSQLRERHPDLAIMVMNLTNGPGWVYLPPADAYSDNRYQAWQTVIGAGSLELLVDAADAAISRLTTHKQGASEC